LLHDTHLETKGFLGPQKVQKAISSNGVHFSTSMGVFGPTTGSVAMYTYVAAHLTMALKESMFQVGLF
jgi:hypothetical protein